MPWLPPSARVACPCCGYPTLGARGQCDVCRLCWWEDDSQDDPDADVVRGGPNHGYSLAQARRNFKEFGVMYEPDRDPRISAPDSELTCSARQALIVAFDQWRGASPEATADIEKEIRKQERVLDQELKRAIKEYEAKCRQ